MTRTEFEKMPRLQALWLQPMQDMADELKAFYSRIELEGLPDPDVDLLLDNLSNKATAVMESLPTWNDLEFVEYTYWCCIEQAEILSPATLERVWTEEERLHRAELMLRCQVYAAWMQACIQRVAELGGKLEV